MNSMRTDDHECETYMHTYISAYALMSCIRTHVVHMLVHRFM